MLIKRRIVSPKRLFFYSSFLISYFSFKARSLLDPAPDNLSFIQCHIGLVVLGHCLGNNNPLHDQFFFRNDLQGCIILYSVGWSAVHIVCWFGGMTLNTTLLNYSIYFSKRNVFAFCIGWLRRSHISHRQ